MLSLIVFSLPVNAETVDLQDYDVSIRVNLSSGGTSLHSSTFSVLPFDDTTQFTAVDVSNISANKELVHTQTFVVESNNGRPLIKKGGSVDFSFYNVCMGRNLYIDGGSWASWVINSARILLFYSDGSMEYVDNVTITNHENLNDLSANFDVEKDIIKFEIIAKQISNPYGTASYKMWIGEGTKPAFRLSIDQQTKEQGLLSGIIEWLKGIKDGITNVFDSIAELPTKLWNLISNGLKSLFVPSEDFIIQFKDDIDGILEDKLGAVYQVVNILTDSWDRITANDQNNVITIPKTTINLPNNNSFSFGGVDVPIVPNGFEFITDIIKTVIGIVCTILFVNGLRKKYDEVMGVEQ